jgi:hypothetical protein
MTFKRPSLYLISVVLFMLVFPIVSILLQWGSLLSGWSLIGRWFVFWAVGVRLFIAGARQVMKPAFTAREIFHLNGEESFIVIKELGFANLSIGLAGILSLFNAEWTKLAAIAGGLFFGLAGLLHVIKKPASTNEVIAMVSDLFIFLLLVLYLIFS